MVDISRYNPSNRTYTGTSANEEIAINEIIEFFPGEIGYLVDARGGNDYISTVIGFDPRSDFVEGGNGDDLLEASVFGSAGGAVWFSGGMGTDNIHLWSVVSFSDFQVVDDLIKFSVDSASGTLEVHVYLDTEYITIDWDDGEDVSDYYYLTEDIARGLFRAVTFDEVLGRTVGANADWFINDFDTFEYALDLGTGELGSISSSIPGVFREGVALRAGNVFDEPDGLPFNPEYAYQWYLNDFAIPDATDQTFFVPAMGAGTYSVAVAYTDAIGYRETLYSPDRFVSAFNNGNGIAGQITSSIAGVFREGLTLGAAGVSADPDGVAPNPNYAYQWFKNGSPIAGATRNTYSVPFKGSGTYRVAVSYTDLQGFRATVNSPNQLVGKNLVGTSRPDTLNGTGGTDLITGLEGADRLFGGGASDTFRYNKFSDSRLSSFDRITDLAISVDVIDGPTAVRASVLSELGQASALSQQGLGRLLNQFVFPVNGAATFAIGSGASRRTFLALDDGSLGFDAKKDALIEITGYTGNLANLSIS